MPQMESGTTPRRLLSRSSVTLLLVFGFMLCALSSSAAAQSTTTEYPTDEEIQKEWESTTNKLGDAPPPSGKSALWLAKFKELYGADATPSKPAPPLAHLYRVERPSHWEKARNTFKFARVPTQFGPAVREDGAFQLRSDLGSLAVIGTAGGIRRYLSVGRGLTIANGTHSEESDAIYLRIAEFKGRHIEWLDPWTMTVRLECLAFANMSEPTIPYLMATPPVIADVVPGVRKAKIFNKCELEKRSLPVRAAVKFLKFITWQQDDPAPCLAERHYGIFFNVGGDGVALPNSGPGAAVTLGDASKTAYEILRKAEERTS